MLERPAHWTTHQGAGHCGAVLPTDDLTPGGVAPAFAPLDHVLGHVKMSSVFYSPSELSEPWAIEIPPMERCLWFHVVTDGRCTFDLTGEPVHLATGDIAVVPHGSGHTGWGGEERVPARSVLDLPHEELTEYYGLLRHGGGGPRTELVCGGIRFDHPAARHLIDALPPLIVVRGGGLGRASWARPMLDLLADEVRHHRAGNAAIVSRLCDVIVIQAVREWIESDPAARSGWLGALRDPQLGAAIAAVHSRPEHPWTVAELATIGHLSRSAFAERFSALVGEPPMSYVRRWRMYRAAELLESRGLSVTAAGRAVGYDSEAAFSRAYKRVMGAPPSVWKSEAVAAG